MTRWTLAAAAAAAFIGLILVLAALLPGRPDAIVLASGGHIRSDRGAPGQPAPYSRPGRAGH